MACTEISGLELKHVSGPRTLVATWDYDGDSHVGFVVEIFILKEAPETWTRRDVRVAFKTARKHTFRNLSLGTGQTWKVVVTTRCADCSLTDMVDATVGPLP